MGFAERPRRVAGWLLALALLARGPPIASAQSLAPVPDAVRLVEGDGVPWLASAATRVADGTVEIAVSGRSLRGGDPVALVTAQEPGLAVTAWDIGRSRAGYGVAFVVAAGARRTLVVSLPDVAANVDLGAGGSWSSYGHPRLVGGAEPPLVTAVRDDAELLLFPARGGPPHVVVATHDGVVVADRDGLAAVYLVEGTLRYGRLDAHLRLTRVSAPFGATRVDRFDAAARDEHTAMLASTPAGTALLVGRSSAGGLESVEVANLGPQIDSPTVMWTDGQVAYAGIVESGTASAHVLKGWRPVIEAGLPLSALDAVVVAVVTDAGAMKVGDAPGQLFFDGAWLNVKRVLHGAVRAGENIAFRYTRQRVPVRDAEPLLEPGERYVIFLDAQRRALRIWPADEAALRQVDALLRSRGF
jgi:hypothetical protein